MNLCLGHVQRAHGLFDAALGRVVHEALQDVGVGGGIATKDATKNGHHPSKVGEVKSPPQAVVRLAEVEDQKGSARFENAVEFLESGAEIRDVSEPIAHRDQIEGVFRKGNFEGVGLDEFDLFVSFGSASGFCEHAGREVDPLHLGSLAGQVERDISRAAADIQSVVARLGCGHVDEFAFPQTVQAEALQVVDQVVLGSDAIKQRLDA